VLSTQWTAATRSSFPGSTNTACQSASTLQRPVATAGATNVMSALPLSARGQPRMQLAQ
jgi:hypothetical protein